MTQARQATSLDNKETERSTQQRQVYKPTVFQSLISGSVAGCTEVMIDHPLWTIKTRKQRGEVFTLNPRILYRGVLANTVSMVPITAIQVGLNRLIQTTFYKNEMALSDAQRLTSAFAAGIGSAFVSCPTEMVMTYQGHTSDKFLRAAKSLVNQGGITYLFRGLSATMMREAMFTSFFLAVTPILKAKFTSFCKNDYSASLMASICAGVGATLASQGIDTLKTHQQSPTLAKPVGLSKAIHNLYSTQGVYGFFKGGLSRGARVISAVTIMTLVNDAIEETFKHHHSKVK